MAQSEHPFDRAMREYMRESDKIARASQSAEASSDDVSVSEERFQDFLKHVRECQNDQAHRSSKARRSWAFFLWFSIPAAAVLIAAALLWPSQPSAPSLRIALLSSAITVRGGASPAQAMTEGRLNLSLSQTPFLAAELVSEVGPYTLALTPASSNALSRTFAISIASQPPGQVQIQFEEAILEVLLRSPGPDALNARNVASARISGVLLENARPAGPLNRTFAVP